MPCRDDWPDPRPYIEIATGYTPDEYNALTRLACDRCKELEAAGKLPEWAVGWWTKHKERDEKRRKEAANAKRKQKLKEDAIAKLTPAERKLLGIK